MFGWLERKRRYRALVEQDADDLVARYGDGAYSEAGIRSRLDRDTIDADRPAGHWSEVKVLIAKRIGKTIGLNGWDAQKRY
jgi:hypothetical protein